MKHEWGYNNELRAVVCNDCGTIHYHSIENDECPGHHNVWADICMMLSVFFLVALGLWAAFFGLGA